MGIINTISTYFTENTALKNAHAATTLPFRQQQAALIEENVGVLTEQYPGILLSDEHEAHAGIVFVFYRQAAEMARHDRLYMQTAICLDEEKRKHRFAVNRLRVQTNEQLADDGFGFVVDIIKSVKNLGLTLST